MEYYFQLQFVRFKRLLVASGVHPAIGTLLILAGFLAGSYYLFYRVDWAAWIFMAIGLLVISQLGNKHRVEQLRWIFPAATLQRIRLLENGLAALPFALFLLGERHIYFAAFLIISAPVLVFMRSPDRIGFIIPTPFKRFPFELPAGIRKAWWMPVIIIFLLVKGIQVHNYGLSLSAMILIALTVMSFYAYPEKVYYAWIHALTPKAFLKHKIRTAWIGLSILCLPVWMAICIAFTDSIWVSSGILALGFVFLAFLILAKYSAYPHEMSIPQGLLVGLSLWFPPMLLFMVPVFYRQAIRQITPYLS